MAASNVKRQKRQKPEAGKHLISVLIPTYNAPEFFRIALESARAQDYAPMEIIVCDNSTDDRTERMMNAAPYRDDPRIRYVRNRDAKTKEENFAPFEHLVRGDYIQWLMHDDVLYPGKLTKMAAVLDAHPEVTLVASQRDIIDEDGNVLNSWLQSDFAFESEYEIFTGESFGANMLKRMANFIGEPSVVLFRRKDQRHPYYHAESRGYKRISDVAMWLELMETGDFALFRAPLSAFRVHAEQEGQQPDVVAESRLEWQRLIEDYYRRDIFLHGKDDYHEALRVLMVDYRRTRRSCCDPTAVHAFSPAWRERYLAMMDGVARELGMPLPADVTISACLIYRNEAPRLPAWLTSATEFCDEFVLVDTGSTDGSADAVNMFAKTTPAPIKSIQTPWQDDFAAVRNLALDAASCDWIVFLDADETFVHPEAVWATLAQLPDTVLGVCVPVINVDEDAGDHEISRFPALRIWRNAKNRRYIGRVHEMLVEDGQPLAVTCTDPRLAVRHTGYSTKRLHAKIQRDLALIEYAVAHGERDARQMHRYLADCYYGLGDYRRALEAAMQAIETEPETVAGKQPLYVLVLEAMKGLERPKEEQLAFARAAHREHPDWLDLAAEEGVLAAACGERAAAKATLTAFLTALDAAEAGEGPALQQATGAAARRGEACRTLAGLALADGDAAAAEPLLRQALARSRYDEAALTFWEAACRARGTAFLASLEEFYDEKKAEDRAFLRGWVIHEGQAAYREALAPDLVPVTCDEAVQRGATELPVLFAALFLGGEGLYARNPLIYQHSARLLPDGLRHILAVHLQRPDAALVPEDADAYLTGLDALVQRASDGALASYTKLAEAFDGATVRQAAERLAAHEHWALAFSLFQQVAADDIGDAAAFWHSVGLCLYHLHEVAADECFARAEAAGCTARDIASYRAWMAAWPQKSQEAGEEAAR